MRRPRARAISTLARILAAARASGADGDPPRLRLPRRERAVRRRPARTPGCIFVGPPAAASPPWARRSSPRRACARPGVPVLPGYAGAQQDLEQLARAARAHGAAAHHQAGRRRGRQGHADRAPRARDRPGARGGAAPRRERLRRRRAAARALPARTAPHRGAGVRRHARHTCCTSASATARSSDATRS